MNIILCGFMGSGKTVVGKELAKIMGRKFVDTDEWIEKKQGVSVKAIFEVHGEDYFRLLESEACREVSNMKNCVISTGGGAMMFAHNVEAVKKSGSVVFLDASFEAICQRIGKSSARPLFRDIQSAKKLYDDRKEGYLSAADFVVDGDMSARKTAMTIAAMFK